ncbi:LOW QUALITY PROTEIN: NhaP-type Na+/H+ or K+/H+ antiporter [Propionibacteriaceae bacterium ES.041]|nr:LOW QUALITY PROTEIN: NhaP-type Na+/H+ or K+/H+ antiporter [Propionibacteriaceae bacterium ES.041]
MNWGLVVAMALLIVWALLAKWLAHRRISLPLVMLGGGLLAGVVALILQVTGVSSNTIDIGIITVVLNEPAAERAVELVLALVLFIDSFEVRRGMLGHQPGMALRLLAIALPLSGVLAMLVGLWLFPFLPVAVVLLSLRGVIPTDLAPTAGLFGSDRRIPLRVKDLLNVESGYNDGIVAPVFVFAITLAGATSHASTPLAALQQAVPAALVSLAVGVVVGAGTGWLMRWAIRHRLTSRATLRFGVVAIPLLTYAIAVLGHGNGFVAAFVAGVAFHAVRGDLAHSEIDLCEDLTQVATAVVWFALGAVTLTVLLGTLTWQIAVFSLAVLTVLRIVPVLLSLLGCDWSWPDRLLIAALGPRGIATMVFGMLAINDLADEQVVITILSIIVTTIIGSFLLHGVGLPTLVGWYARHAPPEDEASDAAEPAGPRS